MHFHLRQSFLAPGALLLAGSAFASRLFASLHQIVGALAILVALNPICVAMNPIEVSNTTSTCTTKFGAGGGGRHGQTETGNKKAKFRQIKS